MSDSDIKNEFRNLGNNLKRAINAAWESEERKRLQQEIQDGLSELGSQLNDLGVQVQESDVTRKVKRDVEELSERVRSGEAQENVRADVVSALQRVNSELEDVIDKWAPDKSSSSTNEES